MKAEQKKIRVFIAHEDIYHAGNPYIYTLVDSMSKRNDDIEFGYGWDVFWKDEIYDYDIVHFQWPQAYMQPIPSEDAAARLEERLIAFRDKGIKIVSTCHDLKPHYTQCAGYDACMSLVYQYSDLIFHLGKMSYELFQKQYPTAQHVQIYHHVYDTIYRNMPTREESQEYLNVSDNKLCILCFGMFRSEEERELVISVAKHLRKKNLPYVILAPSFMKVKGLYRKKWKFIPTLQRFKYWYYRYVLNIHMTGQTWVPIDDAELPYYYKAADVALVHRKSILNSGNAVLPMLFDIAVVGPNVGNVGLFLKEWGYPTFEINKVETIFEALEKAIELQKSEYPKQIHAKVIQKMATDVVATQIHDVYLKLINR